MRIVQFRRHLTGYAVRVTDTKDIEVLQAHPDLTPLIVVKHVLKSGKRKCYNTVSAEFLLPDPGRTTLNGWKRQIWGILKYRKYKGK